MFNEDGKIIGVSGRYLDLIAEKLKINFVAAGNKTWIEAMAMIESGEADIYSNIVPTPERSKNLLFTEVYQ